MNRSILIGTILIVLGFFLNISAKATSIHANSKRIVIKVKKGKSLPQFSGVQKIKHFFGENYVAYTNGDESLIDLYLDHENVKTAYFDTYADTEKLPRPTDVEKVAPQFNKSRATLFNDPKISRLWAFDSASEYGMGVTRAYEEFGFSTGAPVIVAVVDTGVDYNHEDLKDVMWINEDEIPGNGIDDDGNGYIDDIHGINTLERDSSGEATSDIMDKHSHGTHVSGTIAAKQNNGKGIAGVASNVRIMGLRTVPSRGDETDVDVAESFLYAARNGARIINCSFGKSHNEGGDLVKETIDHIAKVYNVLVVTSAGNSSKDIDRYLTYPASFDSEGMIVIASSTKYGRFSYFSNYGVENVDLSSPGSSIYSTTPGNRYGNMSGTSMAAPNASGVAAEVLSRNPSLTAVELKKLLMDNVVKNSSMDGDILTGGIINLNTSLKNL
ncbi:S8 family peptidase [Halobacteriovorax sp. DPLXC-1]|uniref:S8 family peptidase n=1 Tax=Halobacteriovorax sp. DPLXC-1 TaxID=3110771 RepID=UPI002FF2D4E1